MTANGPAAGHFFAMNTRPDSRHLLTDTMTGCGTIVSGVAPVLITMSGILCRCGSKPAYAVRIVKHARGDSMAGSEEKAFEAFMEASAIFTGFSRSEMEGTGMARCYFDQLTEICGTCNRDCFLTYAKENSPEKVFASKYQELARNLIRMWYFGQWNELPGNLAKNSALNTNRVISAASFRSGLGWDAIGTNPPGAKNPGFKSWSYAPR